MGLEGQVDRSRRSDGWFQEVGWMSLEGQLDGSRGQMEGPGVQTDWYKRMIKKFVLKG